MDKNYLKLKSFAEGRGIELFGVADIAGVKGKFNISKSPGITEDKEFLQRKFAADFCQLFLRQW